MAQEVLRQSNFNGGELSPSAVGRRDLKAYASSLALAVNVKITPEGPLLRRGGFRHLDMIRRRLEPVVLETATLTAPNGGTPGDTLGFGGMETTTAMAAADGYVVMEIDFGAQTTVAMFDLIDFVVVEPSSGGGGGLDPLPDPVPPQYPWDRPYAVEA
ncbi:MAG: hypothetical protein KJ728_11890 [Alphaproteobacteria bacterium]|uniref:Uncharacterized protein n=1 Tax=viral metagenome TaxID=1070528 RepID=A0A6M3XBX8_9ZZZZ|nr:hypothetical protein [Alphaproteobacteria bacterium]